MGIKAVMLGVEFSMSLLSPVCDCLALQYRFVVSRIPKSEKS